MRILRFVCCFLFFLRLSPAALAQEEKAGSIAGVVQDNTGAVLPAISVSITPSGGTLPAYFETDAKGEFLAALPPGSYTVSLTLQGFKDFLAKDVIVTAGQTTRVSITLAPAGVTEKVSVEGNAVTQVEQQTSQISGIITSKELTELMLNGRNFTQLAALTPGVSNQTGQDEALVGVKGSVKYSVNGGRVEYNSYEIDGADILNASINGSNSTLLVYPSIDAIDSLQVLTSNYGAEYGRSASGITVATTKAGTSAFHGDLYAFIRNEHFNARNFFDQTRRAPLYRKYDPGGTIGGPLFIPGLYNTNKDKTFFFFSEEYRHEEEPVPYNQAVPSMLERQGIFTDICPTSGTVDQTTGGFEFVRSQAASNAFKALGQNIPYFPDCPGSATNQVIGVPAKFANNGFIVYDTFGPASQLPFNSVSPQSQAIVSSGLFPLPNSTNGCNSTIASQALDPNNIDPTAGQPALVNNPHCYVASISPLTTWRQELVRLDHNFTSKQKLYVHYIHDEWNTTVLSPQYAPVYNSVPSVENNFTGPGLSVAAHFTSTFGTKFVNDLAMTYGHDHITLTNVPGPGVTSLNRSAYSTFTQAPCYDANPQDCTLGGVGYLFGAPANDSNGIPFGNKLPGIVLTGPNFAYGGQALAADTGYMPWHHSNPTYSPRDDATLALRNHTFQFGALAIIAQRNEVNPPVGANTGDVQGTLFLSSASINTSGNVFADLLLFGSPLHAANATGGGAFFPPTAVYTQDSGQGVYHNSYTIIEPYVRDDWKITRRLTLNLGFRASLFGLYHEKFNNAYNWVPSEFNFGLASQLNFFPQTGALVTGQPCVLGQLNCTNNFVPVDLNSLSPYLVNGLVRCGVSKYNNGQLVPESCMTNNHYFNPAPRIGFAWDPFGNGKTSIRGGYGMFFEHGTGNEANTGSLEGSPGNANAGGVISMTQYGIPAWPCIGNVGQSCLTQLSGGNAFPISVTAIPTKAVWPYTQQWNFSVQRELPGKILGSIAYVGSKGTHLTAQLNANQLVPVNSAQNPFLPGQPVNLNFCGVVHTAFNTGNPGSWNGNPIGPQYPGWGNALAACNGLPTNATINPSSPVLPNELRTPGNVIAPFMGQVYSLQNVANSVYHSLQIGFRRTANPITLSISYTYSHSIDDASDRTEATFINAYNLLSNRASSDFDQRHLLNISYVYQLPLMKFYKMLNFADDEPTNTLSKHNGSSSDSAFRRIWDNWELSGITTFQSGTPFSVLNSGSVDGISTPDNAGIVTVAGPASYPDLAANPAPSPSSRSGGGFTFGPLLENPGRFVAPTGLTFGNAGRNYLNNPSRVNFDIQLSKSFPLAEGRSIQFRMETFNIFNHTQFRIYDPSHPGNPGNNVIDCYSDLNGSANDPGCLATSAFLHPIDAHRPRTMQFGFKFVF